MVYWKSYFETVHPVSETVVEHKDKENTKTSYVTKSYPTQVPNEKNKTTLFL